MKNPRELVQHVRQMLLDVLPAMEAGDREALTRVANHDDHVDILHASTVDYLGKISKRALTEAQTREFIKLMEAANNLENIGDIIETDLVGLGNKLIDENVQISAITQEVLRAFGDVVKDTMKRVLRCIAEVRRDELAIDVSGLDEFDIGDFSGELADAERLLSLGMESPTLRRQIFKKLAFKYLSDVRQEVKDRIAREIDADVLEPAA